MRYSVTLVHGTCIRPPHEPLPWTLETGAFAVRFKEELEAVDAGSTVSFHPFLWNGGNSVLARSKASADMRDYLRKQLDDDPEARHIVIAHSHGGNVTLAALEDESVASRVDRIVLLSTPILNAVARDGYLPSPFLVTAGIVTILFLTRAAPQVFMAAAARTKFLPVPDTVWYYYAAWSVAVSGLILLPLLIQLALKGAAMRWENWSRSITASFSLTVYKGPRVLLARITGDEASGALGWVHFTHWLVERALDGIYAIAFIPLRIAFRRHRGTYAAAAAMLTMCGAASLTGALALAVPHSSTNIARVFFGVTMMPALASVLALPIAIVAGFLYVGFGWELVPAAPFMSVSPESTPLGWWSGLAIPRDTIRTGMGLHHSRLHDNPNAMSLVASWILSGHQLWWPQWQHRIQE